MEGECATVKERDVEEFGEVWREFDPEGSNYIRTKYFPAFLKRLPTPIGFSGEDMFDSTVVK